MALYAVFNLMKHSFSSLSIDIQYGRTGSFGVLEVQHLYKPSSSMLQNMFTTFQRG